MPLWHFALHTIFPPVGLLWNAPMAFCTAHNISPCGIVMKCPYGLHSTLASSHDRSTLLTVMKCLLHLSLMRDVNSPMRTVTPLGLLKTTLWCFARYATTWLESLDVEIRLNNQATLTWRHRTWYKLLEGICDVTTRVMRFRVVEVAHSMMQSSATLALELHCYWNTKFCPLREQYLYTISTDILFLCIKHTFYSVSVGDPTMQ